MQGESVCEGVGKLCMIASDSKSSNQATLIGYMAFVDLDGHGFVGGYLIVNEQARPVEFHCTAPVMTNRTQEILYGQVFRPAVLCDQIGGALLKQVSKPPVMIFTDDRDALGIRGLAKVPVAFVHDDQVEQSSVDTSFEVDGVVLEIGGSHPGDRTQIQQHLQELSPSWDVAEPLDRIRAAITEAQRVAA